jgi:hypothetical protein
MDQKQSNKPAIVSCEDLYRQVWETPMLHLGIQYGITGNGLKKICDRWKVPYRAAMQVFDHWIILGTLVDRVLSRRCGKPDIRINLTRRTALIGLSVALPVRAQPTLDAVEPVSLEQPGHQ